MVEVCDDDEVCVGIKHVRVKLENVQDIDFYFFFSCLISAHSLFRSLEQSCSEQNIPFPSVENVTAGAVSRRKKKFLNLLIDLPRSAAIVS